MISVKVNPSCRWCSRTVKHGVAVCVDCERWLAEPGRNERWHEQRYARVEVLSASAAAIVRQMFSKTAVRDDFVFKVDEPVQAEFGKWQTVRVPAGYVETRNGRWVSLWETADEFVPFTLAAAQFKDGQWRRNPMREVEKFAGKWWSSVTKVAKASGVRT